MSGQLKILEIQVDIYRDHGVALIQKYDKFQNDM